MERLHKIGTVEAASKSCHTAVVLLSSLRKTEIENWAPSGRELDVLARCCLQVSSSSKGMLQSFRLKKHRAVLRERDELVASGKHCYKGW